MKKGIEKAVRAIVKAEMFGIAMLLLINVAYAGIPMSDGFDYPVGYRDNFDGWYTSLYLGGSWCEKDGLKCYYGHLGEDHLKISGNTKDEIVYSASNGVVYKTYTNSPDSWGGVVIIQHNSTWWNNFSIAGTTLPDSGETFIGTLYTLYGHLNLSEIYVQEGDNVARRTPIGKIGTVSKFSTPHLHFEIKNQTAIDIEWERGVGHGYSGTNGYAPNHYKPSVLIATNRPQIFPVIGDWDGNGIDETGTFNPRESRFILKDSKDKEYKNQQIGEAGDLPIVGDWNGDGSTNNEDTIGVYRPKEAKFYLDNNNDGIVEDTPEEKFLFGNIGDYPLVGDWDGNGRDEVGVYRVSDDGKKATFYLKKAAVAEEVTFDITANDTPIIGDWNNDGTDDVGVFRRYDASHKQNAVFYLRFDGKITDIEFGDNTDIPIAGKPKKDKLTRIGIYRPSNGVFDFRSQPVVPKSDKPSLDLDYPTGGETWLLGSTQTIQWTSNSDVGTNLNIALLKKGAMVGEMTASVSASSAQITISDTQMEGKDYQVRITSVEKPEYSSISNHFTISATVPIPTPTPTPIPTGPIHNVNKNKDYIKIQDAINDANSEDKINVYGGTYFENINVSMKLTIEGIDSGSGMPTIDAGNKGNVVKLYAGNVTFRNFTLVNASDWSAGIDVPSSGNQILYNKIKNNSYGINFGYNSRDNLIAENIISNGTTGIQLGYFTQNNTLLRNILTNNEYNVYLTYSTKNVLDGNYIQSSSYGLYFMYGADYSTGNWIFRNKFIGNAADTEIKYPYPNTNIWNSTTLMNYAFSGKTYQSYLGNYWDKYAGADSDKDGIGDTPYAISDVSKEVDSYPLVSQNIG